MTTGTTDAPEGYAWHETTDTDLLWEKYKGRFRVQVENPNHLGTWHDMGAYADHSTFVMAQARGSRYRYLDKLPEKRDASAEDATDEDLHDRLDDYLDKLKYRVGALRKTEISLGKESRFVWLADELENHYTMLNAIVHREPKTLEVDIIDAIRDGYPVLFEDGHIANDVMLGRDDDGVLCVYDVENAEHMELPENGFVKVIVER